MKNNLSHSLVGIVLLCACTMSVGGTANAATAGGKCTKAGSTQTTKGVKYKCTKSGKSLKWAVQQSGASNTSGGGGGGGGGGGRY